MKKYSQEKDYKVIAYCVSRFYREEQRKDIFAMCRFAREYHCKVIVFSTLTDLYYDDANDYGEKQIYSMLQAGAFDAIVIMSETFKKTKIDREIVDCANKAGVPVISVNRQLKGCTNIDFNYAESFEGIVRHIVEFHGCRKVNYIGGDTVSKFSKERFVAYKKVLEENGIPFEEKRTGNGFFREQLAVDVLERFLEENELPEAIICANDVMAVAVCSKLRSLGIRVPEDVKVTGFDGVEVEKYHNPRLTTAVYDSERTARTIFEVAIDLSEGKKVQQPVWVPYGHQIGHSCGCNHNHVFSATEELFDVQVYHRDYDDYCQRIINMSSEINKCEQFSELLQLTSELSKKIHYKEYWLCLLEDSYQQIENKLPYEMVTDHKKLAFPNQRVQNSKVILVSHVIGKDKKKTSSKQIDAIELVPKLEELLDKEDYFMLISVQLQGLFIGYIGITYDMQDVNFDFLNLFTMNLKSIIENYWNRMAQEQLMIKDELTNLYNSKGFKKKAERLFMGVDSLPIVTLLLIDLDNLKPINDNYGHAEGDSVLRQFGKFIEQVITKDEICARMEGDQFVIISTNSKGKARGQEIQDSIERLLTDFNMISGKAYSIEVSVGYSSGKNVDELDFKALYNQADKEVYNSKRMHKARG